jgi:hypothetical protein
MSQDVNEAVPLRHTSATSHSCRSDPIPNPFSLPRRKLNLGSWAPPRPQREKWLLPDGRKALSKPVTREALTQLHQASHGGGVPGYV